MLYVESVLVLTLVVTLVKTHQIVHVKLVNFVLYKLYFKKTDKKENTSKWDLYIGIDPT